MKSQGLRILIRRWSCWFSRSKAFKVNGGCAFNWNLLLWNLDVATMQASQGLKFWWYTIEVVVVSLFHFTFHFVVLNLHFVLHYNPNSPCVNCHSLFFLVSIMHGNLVVIDFLCWSHIPILNTCCNVSHYHQLLMLIRHVTSWFLNPNPFLVLVVKLWNGFKVV